MKLIKKYFLRLLILLTSVLFLVGCDQATKKLANAELKNKVNTKIAGIVNLHYVENDGGMLSLGSNLPQEIKFTIFILLVGVFLLILFVYLVKQNRLVFLKQFAMILILSGGLGNLIDRISNNGKVIDFIRLELPGFSTGIFNIADFYVTIGFVILMLSLFIRKKFFIQEKIG